MKLQLIDLSALELPPAVEIPDYEDILTSRNEALIALAPQLADVLTLESEPATKLLEENSWRARQ